MTLVGIEKELLVPSGTRNSSGNAVTQAIKELELIDPDKINPIEYRVLLRVAAVSDLTGTGGIFKPESLIAKEQFNNTHATVIAVGDEAFTAATGDYVTERPKKGDRVITAKYAGNVYRDKENNLYRFCNDKDVVAIIKDQS
jgi:co-chaperonin GroES (HSP10)